MQKDITTTGCGWFAGLQKCLVVYLYKRNYSRIRQYSI
ncbi:hypothetical protein QFZ51_003140 [Chitinophaga sp. W3I9]